MAGCSEDLREIQDIVKKIQDNIDKLYVNTLTQSTKVSEQTLGIGGLESHVMDPPVTGGGRRQCFFKDKVTKIIMPPRSKGRRVEGTYPGNVVGLRQAAPRLTRASTSQGGSGAGFTDVRTTKSKFKNKPSHEDSSDSEGSHESIRAPGHRRWTVPGYNYLGPGSPLDGAPPVNKVDEIAKRHDEEYYRIEQDYKYSKLTEEEAFNRIQKADTQMVDELMDVEPKSPLEFVGKYVGGIGLFAKKSLEKLLHKPLYPALKR